MHKHSYTKEVTHAGEDYKYKKRSPHPTSSATKKLVKGLSLTSLSFTKQNNLLEILQHNPRRDDKIGFHKEYKKKSSGSECHHI